jgi:HK97 family phage portal protein
MGIIAEAFNPRPSAEQWSPSASPINEGWYAKDIAGYMYEATSGSGLHLTADTILNCGTVLAAVRFRGDSWAMCPPSTYRKTKDGRVAEPDHYSERVLRYPNTYQTDFRWRQLNGVRQALWGNAHNEIIANGETFAGELRPLPPMHTKPVDQRNDGTLLYLSNPPGQPEKRLGQEKVLHFRDLSTDGINGLEMYRLIRNVVGIALLAERHTTTFLRKGTRISGLLVPTAPLEKEQRDALRESVNQDFGGSSNTGTLGVLPHGVDLKELSKSMKDSMTLDLDDQTVGKILRFLNVPGVVVGYSKDLMGYASADAFYEKGGIRQCVLPILTNAEAEVMMALLLRDSGIQIKHNLDVLNRANTKERYEAIFRAVGGPWMSVNEARRQEDMNPMDDPRYDEVLTPSNMAPELQQDLANPGSQNDAKPPATPKPQPAPAPQDDSADATRMAEKADRWEARQVALVARAETFARIEAARIVRKEIAAIQGSKPGGRLGAANKTAGNPDAWKVWVADFYGERHPSYVADTLGITPEKARAYCASQADALLANGVGIIEAWEDTVAPKLVALALEAN